MAFSLFQRGRRSDGRRREATTPHPLPPPADRRHRELRRVAADPHRDPRFVPVDVVHAAGHRLAQFGVRKIVYVHLLRILLRPVRSPRILVVSQHFWRESLPRRDVGVSADAPVEGELQTTRRWSCDHTGVHSRRGSAQSTLHGLVRADDARDDSAWGCLYLRGVPEGLPEGRLSSQRALRDSADGAAGGDLIQVTELSASRAGRSPISPCFRGIR
jgi:hypothetical protein